VHLTLTFPKVDCAQPPCSHKYGMWIFTPILLHVFNYWGFDTLQRKLEGLHKTIFLESGLRLIPINISPLDPFLEFPLSYGNLSPHYYVHVCL
jgi:hypothetical protein